ncbi:MAG: adenylate/guanylate cyclase domain-containing protein [Candidatus Binatus sp.]
MPPKIIESGPTTPASSPGQSSNERRYLALLNELPILFAQDTAPGPLLQRLTERLVETIPGATRGAMLLTDRASGKLLLRAHVPTGKADASLALAQRAMDQRQGFIWRQDEDESQNPSTSGYRVESAMYAPMLWRDETLGVVCADSQDSVLDADDLQLMVTIAHYAATAAVQQRLQDDVRQNASLLTRLMTNFSPKIRTQLLARARNGRLRLGGEKSEIVVMISDLRSFTRMSMDMEAEDVFDMLNDYLAAESAAVFKHDGTIDKFMGDGILAVFGSPEPDPARHQKAVAAALAMQDAMKLVNASRRASGQVTCEAGIGIHCGQALHGFVGSNELLEFTVIGDTVNLAQRLEGAASGGEILISREMHQRVWETVDVEPITIETKHEGPLPAFRLRGIKDAHKARARDL